MTDDSFVFYGTFREQLKELPDDMRLKFYDFICDYGLTGTVPDVRGIEKALWIPIQFAIERAKEKRAQNQKNGAKGGRPADQYGSNPAQPELPGLPEEPAVNETAQPAGTSTTGPAMKATIIEDFEQKPKESDNNPAEPEHNRIEATVTEVKPAETQPNPIKANETGGKPDVTENNLTGTGGNPIKPDITEEKRPEPEANLNVNGNVNVNSNGNVNSSSESQQVSKNNSTTTTFSLQVQEHLHKLCFDFDENAVSRITSVLVCFGYLKHLDYLDYCLDMLCRKKFPDKPFSDKPKPEQQTLFLTAVTTWQDWKNGFPKWLAEQEKAAKQKDTARIKANPPAVCPDCGTALIRENGQPVCTRCNQLWEFESGTQDEPAKWVKYKRPAAQDFSGIWKNIPRPAAQKPQAEEHPAVQFDIF
jgi:hypothetical protein